MARERVGGGSTHRIRRVLVAVQVGLAVVLLVQISLFARTAWNFRTMETGFDPRGVLTFRVDLPETRYADAERITQFYRALLTRIDGLPGVVSSGTINRLPVADRELSARIKVEGDAARRGGGAPVHRPCDGESRLLRDAAGPGTSEAVASTIQTSR